MGLCIRVTSSILWHLVHIQDICSLQTLHIDSGARAAPHVLQDDLYDIFPSFHYSSNLRIDYDHLRLMIEKLWKRSCLNR